MNEVRKTRLRSPLVNDVLRVCRVVKLVRPNGSPYCRVTLAGGVSRYEVVAGAPAAALLPGELVQLRGCILRRRGKPAMAASSLIPVNQPTELHPARRNESGNQCDSGTRDDHTVRASRG